MFCSKCGHKIEDNEIFCGNCGNAVREEQSVTSSSVTAARKSNNKLPVILSICAAAIILIVVSIAVFGKKADKVTKIVDAYENTKNAENFDVRCRLGQWHYFLEVFGKGNLEKAYIAEFRGNADDVVVGLGKDRTDNWLKCIDEDNIFRLIHDDYYLNGGRDKLENNASNWHAYDEYEMIAERDFAGLWNQELDGIIDLNYDEAYDFAINVVLDYLKNKDASVVETIEIEDNVYSMYINVDDFAEGSEYQDTVKKFIEDLEDGSSDMYNIETLHFEVALDSKYIKSIFVDVVFDGDDNGENEATLFSLQFANINELTKETSVAYKVFNDYYTVDIDAESDTLLDASDSCIGEVVESYIGDRNYYGPNFTDELITQRDELLETEPYKTINENGIDSVTYENNIATIEVEDSEETYQFQIEFNEAGDKISKITYIAPMASMSEEENQEYMVEHEVIPAYEKYISENPINTSQESYSFIFMNDDTIPELVIQGDCEAIGNMICTYIDNKVVSMYTSRLMFSFLEKQNLLNNTGGNMGSYYDKIFSIKDGAFECVYSGEWMESYDYSEGHVITDENGNILYEYLWNGQQVSSDEYKNSLAQVYNDDKAIWNYDLSYYSSIQEAYENLGKITFSE